MPKNEPKDQRSSKERAAGRYRNEEFLLSLGKGIRRVRMSKGYSIDRMYLESGMSRATISHMERGIIDPQASTLFRYAETLGVTLATLMAIDFLVP